MRVRAVSRSGQYDRPWSSRTNPPKLSSESHIPDVLERQDRREVDVRARLDERNRQTAERVSDDNRIGLRPDQPGVVVLVLRDVVAGEIGRADLVPARGQLASERLEAPAAVPGAMDEHESHGAEYPRDRA